MAAPWPQLFSVLYLALFPTVIGFACWSYALKRAPASRVASFLYLQPLMGCVIAYFWLGEIHTWLTVVGGTLRHPALGLDAHDAKLRLVDHGTPRELDCAAVH